MKKARRKAQKYNRKIKRAKELREKYQKKPLIKNVKEFEVSENLYNLRKIKRQYAEKILFKK